MKEKFNQIVELAKKSNQILVTSHLDPDGDSIGSQLALAGWLRTLSADVRVINQSKVPAKYLFLDEERVIKEFETVKNSNWQPDVVFVLECPTPDRAGEVKTLFEKECKIINLDHHPDNVMFGDISYVETQASALGEIIYELLTYAGYRMNKQTATWLYAAILTDTGRFRFSNTTPQAMRIAAELISLGAIPREISNQIYYNNSGSALKLLGFALQNLQTFKQGKISFLVIDQKILQELKVSTEELEGFVDYSLFLKGAEVGVLFTEKNGSRTKVSLRSQNSFDVSALARSLGGGGHKNAAGCTVERNLDSTKELILKKIEEVL